MIQKLLEGNKSLDEKALKNIDPYSFLLFGMFTAISSPRSLIGSPRKELLIHGSAWQFEVTTSRAIVVPRCYTLSRNGTAPIFYFRSTYLRSSSARSYFKNFYFSISVFRYFRLRITEMIVQYLCVGRGREPTDPPRIFLAHLELLEPTNPEPAKASLLP